jgi:hypothetical protein
MDAAWAEDGRIVVRRPGAEDYGVELAAPADLSRPQARLVGSDRPQAPRDAARDTDQETIWCGQFNQLRAIVAGEGGRIEIERALAPGEQAVKTVTMPAAQAEIEASHTTQLRARPARYTLGRAALRRVALAGAGLKR